MQKQRTASLLLLSLVLFWALALLGGYYYYHKPINLEMIAPPLNAFLDLLFVLLFAGLAGGLGRRLMRAQLMRPQQLRPQLMRPQLLRPFPLPPLEGAAVQFALGAGILSLVWLVLGLLGLYHLLLAVLLLILGLLLLRQDARAWYRQIGTLADAWQDFSLLEKWLAVVAGVLILYQMTTALAPPITWDALAYHLQLPRQYLDAGRLVFIQENPYWGQPQVAEMLYTFAMAFHRAETAALLGWLVGLIGLIGLFGLTNTQLNKLKASEGAGPASTTAGWMAVIATLAGTTFRHQLSWAYSDLFMILFGLAALVMFLEWLDNPSPTWFLWTGVFTGFAIGVKWTAGVLALGLFGAAFLFRKRQHFNLKYWLISGLLALVIVLPWFIKNQIATGNPLYPYMANTSWMTPERLDSAGETSEPIQWWPRIFAVFASTIAGVDSAAGFSTDLGPLLLLFALPGFWRYRRSAKTQTLALCLLPALLGLSLGSVANPHLMQTRLYFAVLPALVLPCGWGWEWLQCQVLEGVRLRRIFSALIILVMTLIFWQESYFIGQITPGRYILGTQTSQSYLENTLGFHIGAMQAVEQLPAGSHTLMLWEPRGLYAPLSAQADLWIDRWRTDRREQKTASAVLSHWKQQGFTHLLIYQPGPELIRPKAGQAASDDWTAFQKLLTLLPAPQMIGNYALYSIP